MESNLYNPIKKYFAELGYEVKSEILNCDIALVKDNELIIVEMKKNFCLKLVYQALDRVKFTNSVYVAVPTPKRHDKNAVKLLRELEIGLIYVSEVNDAVNFILHPIFKNKDNKKKRKLLKEFNARKSENTGGVNKQKIMTAYREKSVKIALILMQNGEMSAGDLIKNFECEKDTHNILYQNHYNWFVKIRRGVYNISDKCAIDLKSGFYEEIVNFYIGGQK